MPRLIPRTASTVLDASGSGTVSLAIDNANRRWRIDSTLLQTSQPANTAPVPRATTYKNIIGPQGFEGGTNSGNFDTSVGTTDLYAGDTFYVVWTGGRPGDTATATINGEFTRAGEDIED